MGKKDSCNKEKISDLMNLQYNSLFFGTNEIDNMDYSKD